MVTIAIDQSRLEAFMGQAVVDLGASFSVSLAQLDGESELGRHLHRSALPAFEVAGGETAARGELVGDTQDRLRRVAASLPDQVVRRGRGEAVLGKERSSPRRSYSWIERTTSSWLTRSHAGESFISFTLPCGTALAVPKRLVLGGRLDDRDQNVFGSDTRVDPQKLDGLPVHRKLGLDGLAGRPEDLDLDEIVGSVDSEKRSVSRRLRPGNAPLDVGPQPTYIGPISNTMIRCSSVPASSDCFRAIDIALKDVWRQRVRLHGQHPSRPPANQNRRALQRHRHEASSAQTARYALPPRQQSIKVASIS
jgi:hypothetical protein